MNKYKVHGEYTISFDVEVIAESEDDAENIADGINFWESTTNCICADPLEDGDEPSLNADGIVEVTEIELIEEDISDDEEED